MFYTGDLQSGISKAVQESKFVAALVTDDEEESKLWENEFLEDPSLKSSFDAETVLLRLVAGSQEAGFLAAIFPLPKTPTLVVIENGQLKEYIAAGVSKEDFLRRLGVMFQTRSAAASLSATSQHTTSLPASNSVQNIPTTSSSTATPAPAGNQTPQDVQSILADRKARLEAQKKEQEARAAAKRAADSKARNAALNDRPEGSEKSADMKYALMQKKRAQDAKDERARILKRVEDDKIRRKQEAAQQKALAKERQNPGSAGDVAEGGFDAVPPSKYSKECALQVRLFDGSTIRSRFPSEGSLRADVRPWIDKQQTGDVPYNFKHVLTPLPNKNISISDEEGSLHSQGLTPSATLILVPIQGYTSAYSPSATNLLTQSISTGYGVVSSGVGLVTGVLGSLFGTATPTPASTQQPSDPAPASASSNINVRTLRDQDRADDRQFYNGNALNFEPRNDGEDKKDD